MKRTETDALPTWGEDPREQELVAHAIVRMHPDGLTLEELARVLGVSKQAVQMTCERLYAKCRRALSAEGVFSYAELDGTGASSWSLRAARGGHPWEHDDGVELSTLGVDDWRPWRPKKASLPQASASALRAEAANR